jgi:Na+/melibiose symporter-like transporter
MWFDLRLLGLAMRNQAVSEVFDDFRPWMLAGFAIMFLTGFLLFWSHAEECYGSTYFRLKFALLWLMVKKR